MSQVVNRKQKTFLGMTSFQVGVLFLLSILACGVIGLLGFLVLNNKTENGLSDFNFISPSGKFVGKWEVISGTNIGMLYEFFPDGTVSGGGASEYSFPDKTHIKIIELGQYSVVYEYVLSGDELILSTGSSSRTLKKYSEFNLSPQVIAGTWKYNGIVVEQSECFKGEGIKSTPQEITLGVDGTISFSEGGYYNYTMNGQYTINGNNLYATTSGVHEESGTNAFGLVVGTPSQVQVQGEINCAIKVSNSRLTFTDASGKDVLFVRVGK